MNKKLLTDFYLIQYFKTMQNLELIDIPLKEAEFTVLDFETTGTSARLGRAIEIGLVRVKKLKVAETYSTFINPEMYVPFHITRLTGITNANVSNAPLFDNIEPEISKFIEGTILVAHNLPFDRSFLNCEYERLDLQPPQNDGICTLKMARKLYPELPSKALGSVTKHLRIRHKDVHRALGDATVTAKIFIKMIKKLQEEHNVETLKDLISFQSAPKTNNYRIIKKKLSEDLSSVPLAPGVYFFKDNNDKIFYIGKAKSLKKRVSNYFANTAITKAKKIVTASSRLGFKVTNSELTALITEAELIKVHKPTYNRMLKKYGQTYFVKVDKSQDYPVLKSTTKFDFDGNDYFGPYIKRDIPQYLIDISNRTYQLRECKEKDFKKQKVCYLHDIERCLAPCINDIQEDYFDELDSVYHFLGGQNQAAVNKLLNKMKQLSEQQKYEEAAEIRDTVQRILKQLDKSAILAEPINKANVLIEIKGYEKKDYLLMLQGKVFIKNDPSQEKDYFDEALEDYFNGTVSLFENLDDRDLERTKIALSWLAKNRHKIEITHLSNYTSISDLELRNFK